MVLLAGCANPVAQFYQGMTDVRSKPAYDASARGVQIYTTDDFERDRLRLARKGFFPIGQSTFNAAASSVGEAQVLEHATAIGAHIVLVASRYSHTVTGATPLTIPNSSTSFSSGTATAYGPGGTVQAYGTGTTTTYGSQTVMVPFSVARSDFTMLFFAKNKNLVGISPVPLDDATRQRLQTNIGARVESVVDDSPAFVADILPGDVVLSIDGAPVTENSFWGLIKQHAGRRVNFELDRGGTRLTKDVQIRASY
ncbi:MAG TPA: PDZ domain-containing protein [Zeimonas sp.]|nr:PDZ domain-containing protein [Zeimonas sp.]